MLDLAIIGGGAAGFFAAINIKSKHPGLKIEIFEKSKNVLSKVRISGGGRCNVTHACYDPKSLINFYPRGQKELLSVFQRFSPKDTIQWFESRGVILKSESDGRVFPVSDSSDSIIECFQNQCRILKIPINISHNVQSIDYNGSFKLSINENIVEAKKILIASGSSDNFWNIIKGMGHTIIPPVPSLFTFNIKDELIEDLMGLSVPYASIKLVIDKEIIKANKVHSNEINQSGPLLITHWGLSGPAILKLSAIAARLLHQLQYQFSISVNFSQKNTEETLEELLIFKNSYSKKQIVNTPLYNIPQRWWQRIHSLSFTQTFSTWADVSKKELYKLAENLSNYPLRVDGKSTFKDEFVTAGGVDLKEIDFKSMQSKLLPGLYFGGEVLNIDAVTGGFNFQAAWSEAWVISEEINN